MKLSKQQPQLFEEVMAYTETPVGLKTIIEKGDGLEAPECGDLVEVHCTGLFDGTPVWSSRDMGKPIKLTLDKGPPQVKKVHAALKTMKMGEKAHFTIPFVLSDLPKEDTPIQVAVEMLSWEKVRGKKKPNAKRNKRNANAAPWHGKLVQAEGLPSGWLMGRKIRTQGKGYNKYYIQPGTGKLFKSKKGVERFLEQEKDLGAASNEREEDTPRTELDASEEVDALEKYVIETVDEKDSEDVDFAFRNLSLSSQDSALDEIENLRRQLRDAVNEKNKFETQYKEQLLLNNQIMKQMEELTCEKQRRQDLEEGVKSLSIAFASRQESMKSFVEDFKSKLGRLKAQSCQTE